MEQRERCNMRDAEGRKEGEREEVGGTEGAEGEERDQAGCRERTDSGGNNDMKGESWRSHTALAHLRRHKISWPLHTHTRTQTQTNTPKKTCMYACKHIHFQMHVYTHKERYRRSGKAWTQPEALQQREVSYEQNIWTQLSSQLCLHWLTFTASVDQNTQCTTNKSRINSNLLHFLSSLLWAFKRIMILIWKWWHLNWTVWILLRKTFTASSYIFNFKGASLFTF